MLLIGYEMFRNLVMPAAVAREDPGAEAAMMTTRSFLCAPGPNLIILDEVSAIRSDGGQPSSEPILSDMQGHRIRSDKARLYDCLSLVRTRRRIILTGFAAFLVVYCRFELIVCL